ncbi:MAG: CBS domain-containing protein [Nitrosopumilus sp.]|nr:CBS domain-containing protein [Nitrosopumilus sp.]CAI9831373.1 XRE family transcriptional regulator [Nitrosopumilaceae archaeon]MDA7940889.1 CBS domain-containing protein [Nitrosopumilus sp.]MDA7943255.1 CBS domain-containing protein [Nitrosopumilus sp.]MDA7944251.1 CBS domain-containing protein [Nitrosopumilus sp.]
MLPGLGSIKQGRTRLGITQRKLASLAGVSPSMINQIESGRCSPSYQTARRIFEELARLEGGSSPHTAGEFCSRGMVKMGPSDTLESALKRMRDLSISQIPVFDGDDPVGLVSEDGVIRHLSGPGPGLKGARLAQMMDPVPPIVDGSTPAGVLVPLILHSKCILVSEKSRVVGIITASDTLRMV